MTNLPYRYLATIKDGQKDISVILDCDFGEQRADSAGETLKRLYPGIKGVRVVSDDDPALRGATTRITIERL